MKLIKLVFFTLLFSSNAFSAQWKLSHEVESGKFNKLCVYAAMNGSAEVMTVEKAKGEICRIYI